MLTLGGCAGQVDPAGERAVAEAGAGGVQEPPAEEPTVAATRTAGAGSPTVPGERPATATPAPFGGQTIEVTYRGGRTSGNTGRVPVPLGETVQIVVTSDVADEIHLHGYDVTAPVAPGQPATLTVEATIPGIFEVELHEVGEELLSIQVS